MSRIEGMRDDGSEGAQVNMTLSEAIEAATQELQVTFPQGFMRI